MAHTEGAVAEQVPKWLLWGLWSNSAADAGPPTQTMAHNRPPCPRVPFGWESVSAAKLLPGAKAPPRFPWKLLAPIGRVKRRALGAFRPAPQFYPTLM